MLEIELTWEERGRDDKGRLIGGHVWAICDQVPCTNHIRRGAESVCGGTHDLKPHCGRYFCGDHLPGHEKKNKVMHLEDVSLDKL